MTDEHLVNQRSGAYEQSPIGSFWSQIRGMFGSLDTARVAAAMGTTLSKPPEGEWVSGIHGDLILL